MSIERIRSRAPTRIDLAGGTVDIWPIYLFLDRALTLNLAIDLFAEATLEVQPASSGKGSILLGSEDQKQEARFVWKELETATAHPALDLQLRLLRHFARVAEAGGVKTRDCDLSLKTLARSPSGAGLGGSSALNVALTGALATWAWRRPFDPERDGEKLIEVSRDIETTVIRVPAGLQDYYGAMFGGLQSLGWGAGAHSREALAPAEILLEMESRLLLFYSGQSRNSGINNWQLFKGFIDQDVSIRKKFEAINRSSHALRAALLEKDWNAVADAIRSEWDSRQTLAPGISTPEIDGAFEAARELVPDCAAKICGAGGGGCFFIYLPDPSADLRADVASAIEERGGVRALPFRAVPHGLEVKPEIKIEARVPRA